MIRGKQVCPNAVPIIIAVIVVLIFLGCGTRISPGQEIIDRVMHGKPGDFRDSLKWKKSDFSHKELSQLRSAILDRLTQSNDPDILTFFSLKASFAGWIGVMDTPEGVEVVRSAVSRYQQLCPDTYMNVMVQGEDGTWFVVPGGPGFRRN